MLSRRGFLWQFLAGGVSGAALRDDWASILDSILKAPGHSSPEAAAQDEDFWSEIQRAFTVDRTIINLNNGGVSPSPRVVQEAMARYLALSNEAPAHTMWNLLEPQIESVRRQLAASFGCDPEELAITRNASEALEICQLGMDLQPGDEVLTTNQDYGRMLTTWDQRVRRDGIVLKQISFPVPPPGMRDLVQRFERAITARTRVIHCCHITNLTGQIFPVREIVHMARARGIEVIVDGAHAYAHFPFTLADLDCDYYGTSLHKWLLAPHGTGFLYVRKSKIEKLWPLMAAPESMNKNIRKFEEIGTHPAANHNAIAEALAFHEGIGAERKAARLRYLRDRWMKRLEGQRGVTLFTSFDPKMSCGLATVGVDGLEPGKIAEHMWTKRRIMVTPIVHAEFKGVRVTPNVYTTVREVDTFAEAMEGIVRNGIAA
ncbi:MAG TPA: aminotransferase class V-fold PLP-dependent enzyme [Longimicrobiales bacterium]